MASHYLRKYGVAATLDFELYKADGTGLKTDAVSATGDVTLNRDEGNQETLDADAFADEGMSYSLALSEAEMTAARIIVHVVDQTSPQAWLDKVLIVETYGNASAMHPFDLSAPLAFTGAYVQAQVKATDNIDLSATQKASVEDAVWDGAIADHDGEGTFGLKNQKAVPSETINDYKADVSALALEAGGNLEAVKKKTDGLNYTGNYVQAQVKATDDIDLSDTQKASVEAAVDAALENVVPANPAAGSLNDLVDRLLKIGKNKWAIADTTFTIYDDDGKTALYTFTLDSATAPTSRTPA